jgi:phosphatidylinositol glycan class B
VTLRAAIVLFAALQIPAAFLSLGRHHADEHFQILEFLNYKLGLTPASELPWEFGERMRPFIQVAAYFPLVLAERAAGIISPFAHEITLRVTSALLGIIAFALALRYFAERYRFGTRALLAMATWAALPYLNARLSSETVGASVFVIGVVVVARAIDDRHRTRLFAGGLLLGLAFCIRFQLAFMLLGLAAWLLVEKRVGGRAVDILWLACGFILAVLVGAAADRWGYGVWVFTPWRYFDVNLLQHKAATWGTAPWWAYLRVYLLMPPFGLICIGALGWFLWRDRRSLLVYLAVPFLVGHSLIGHKEQRFLFPLALLLTMMLGACIETMVRKGWTTTVYRTLLAINAVWLLVLPYRAANFEVMFYRYVYTHDVREIYSKRLDPYVIGDLEIYFYRPPGTQVHLVPDDELQRVAAERAIHVFTDRLHPFEAGSPLARGCVVEYESVPAWAEKVNVNNWLSRVPNWSLYRCRLPDAAVRTVRMPPVRRQLVHSPMA